MKKHIFTILCTVLSLLLTACPVFAATADSLPAAEEPAQMLPSAPAPVTVYPAEVRASEENGISRLEKVYYLTADDDPALIPTEDFEREGMNYTLLDLLKNDQRETDTKDYTEVLTLDSDTKDLAEIINALEPELAVVTEDGYEGILTPDYPSIIVEPAGYKTSNRTVSASRQYPNLSDADISLIPKSIEDSGRTLTLADVNWQEAATDYVDGSDIALRYTANATYTGTATSKSATSYTVTISYSGEVTKTSCDTIVYTAVFSASGSNAEKNTMDKRLLLIPAGAVALGAAGYGGYKGYKHYQNKKRGYE